MEAQNVAQVDGASAIPEIIRTPFLTPPPSSKPNARPPLTPEQDAKYSDLLKEVSSWTTLPTTSARSAPTAPITDDERMWLTHECLLRYLRATKWNAVEAPRRLQATLVWRREYHLVEHTADYISPENESGKQVILGYDNAARPCLYLRPGFQNTKKSERQIQHLVYMLERVVDFMPPGQDTIALLINFGESTAGSNPSFGQGRQALGILQGHYPERLGRSLIINLPWHVNGFFKLITPFIDPLTREKLVFNGDVRQHVPPEQLWSTMGGDTQFEYDHSIYWPAMNKIAAERRKLYQERWIQGGKRVGERESFLNGGNEPSVAASEQAKMAERTPDVGVEVINGTNKVEGPQRLDGPAEEKTRLVPEVNQQA
ncbi:MAG: hypothetical protein M1817_005693 [Caeruleum heppii]|nr:MAG: hypothetical protein M1817_005693 [Caeruleum heppii]